MRTERHGTWGCVLAVVAVVTSGCSSGAAAPPDPPATGSTSITRATTGTISGVVRLYGGPYGPVVEPGGQTRTGQALNGNPGPNEQFFVSSASGERFSAKSNAQGNFSLILSPGSYTLECSQRPTVTVSAGTTVQQDCGLPVP